MTRAFYKDYDAAFVVHWKHETGETVVAKPSHGGSGKLARSVIDGLGADVITMNQAGDIDIGRRAGGLRGERRRRVVREGFRQNTASSRLSPPILPDDPRSPQRCRRPGRQ